MKVENGLSCYNINANQNIVIDPDNVFWAISQKHKGSNLFASRNILSLYEKYKDKLDKELNNFRFSKNLTAIYIDPTDRCNANCAYCYVPEEIRKNGTTMTEEQIMYVLKKTVNYFKNSQNTSKKPVIVFHASEPLLVKKSLFNAISKFKNHFSFGLQTNAILLEKKDIEFLKNNRIGVGISLDSHKESMNNLQRETVYGNGNFNRAVRAIELFNGYHGLNVITTITKFNVKHLPDLIKFLHSKKVVCVLLNPVRLTLEKSRELKPDQKLLTRYFIEAVKTAIELSKKSKHRIIIGNFTNVVLGIVAPVARRLMCDISPCGGGRCFLTITAKGDMIPCGEFIGISGFSGGNIFKNTIKEAMESNPFNRIRARIVEKIAECRVCDFRNICGAPCPAELHSLGNMYKKSVFCEFYKDIIKYAFELIAKGEERYLFREDSLKALKYEYKWAN